MFSDKIKGKKSKNDNKSGDETSLDLISKELNNARIVAHKKTKISEVKEKARVIKGLLQQHIGRGDHSDEVLRHLEQALHSCNACIHATDNEASDDLHNEVIEHLDNAEFHFNNAVDTKKSGKSKHRGASTRGGVATRGIPIAKPQLHHVLQHTTGHGVSH